MKSIVSRAQAVQSIAMHRGPDPQTRFPGEREGRGEKEDIWGGMAGIEGVLPRPKVTFRPSTEWSSARHLEEPTGVNWSQIEGRWKERTISTCPLRRFRLLGDQIDSRLGTYTLHTGFLIHRVYSQLTVTLQQYGYITFLHVNIEAAVEIVAATRDSTLECRARFPPCSDAVIRISRL